MEMIFCFDKKKLSNKHKKIRKHHFFVRTAVYRALIGELHKNWLSETLEIPRKRDGEGIDLTR